MSDQLKLQQQYTSALLSGGLSSISTQIELKRFQIRQKLNNQEYESVDHLISDVKELNELFNTGEFYKMLFSPEQAPDVQQSDEA